MRQAASLRTKAAPELPIPLKPSVMSCPMPVDGFRSPLGHPHGKAAGMDLPADDQGITLKIVYGSVRALLPPLYCGA